MPKKREFQINPHKCQKVREVQIEIPQILKKCGKIQIENLQMAKRSFLAFLVVPMDKKHSKTFSPLFRSNYIKSWCNLNSPEWIWKKLTKWLITDLIFFYVSEWSKYEAQNSSLKMDLLFIKLFLLLAIFTAQVEPHGRLIEPPSRSTMWR